MKKNACERIEIDVRLQIPADKLRKIEALIAKGKLIRGHDEETSIEEFDAKVDGYTFRAALMNGSTTPKKGPYLDLFVIKPGGGEVAGEHEPIMGPMAGRYRIRVGETDYVVEIAAA